jgi:[ribosomal protein S18]-alanine N-acetyltransferase
MDAFSIRPAAEDDIPKIVIIEKEVHVAPWTEEAFLAEMKKPFSKVWVMTDDETDERVAGYIAFWVVDKECRILNIAVPLPFRGLGVAKDLIRAMIREAIATGATHTELEVRKGNLAAIQLYQKLGFTIIQVRKNYYSNGEDAYIMELLLEGKRSDF